MTTNSQPWTLGNPNPSEEEEVIRRLTAARALLEAGWTQAAVARTARGVACRWESPRAVSFCAIGAVARVTDDEGVRQTCWFRLRFAMEDRPPPLLAAFNDSHSREEVLALFDRAIAQATTRLACSHLPPLPGMEHA